MFNIYFRQGSQKLYIAWAEGHDELCGEGELPNDAVIDLIRHHGKELGIVLHDAESAGVIRQVYSPTSS